jgi:PhnB protein
MATKKVKPIPEGYHTATPYLTIRGTDKAIEFYKKAFGAEEMFRMPGSDGKGVMHAEIRIGDSVIMMGEEMPGMPNACVSPSTLKGSTMGVMLYVQDVDAAFKRATDAGATAVMPPQDMFWGDRYGKLMDPFGHHWSVATHKEDVPPQEMEKRHKAFVAQMSKGKK